MQEKTKLAERLDSLASAVAKMDGLARTATLLNEWSEYDIARAVRSGVLQRVRKGWVALPSAEAALTAVAKAGVVLTCLTQAHRLGLWVLDVGSVSHVGAPAHSGAVKADGFHVHWRTPPVARHPDAVTDPIENVLALVSTCQPHERALAIWESALRKGLVSLEALRGLDLPPAARRLCAEATPWSDSGLESFVPPRLRWLDVRVVPQAWIAGRRVDFLIGDRLVLQIDGGHHVGAQREADVAHDAQLMVMGYHVIRVGYWQVVERWHEVQDLITRAIAQGLHREPGGRHVPEQLRRSRD